MKTFALVPYLMLVSFFTPPVQDFGVDKINSINNSPYQGIAVPLVSHYETRNFSIEHFERSLAILKTNSQKQIWPWVFFNKFIGYEEGHKVASKKANRPYFNKIRGMDLKNEAGALEDFYLVWRTALTAAKELGSPGIIVDPEPYNNYSTYWVSYVSERQGMSEDQVREQLKGIGAKLTDLADESYPNAKIWFLLTGLTSKVRTSPTLLTKDHRTVTYIVLGMLERASEKKSKLEIICGGELWGYCFQNSDDLQRRILDRKKQSAPLVEQYPNLTLAGTIAPWADAAVRQLWMVKYTRCIESEAKKMADFEPLIQQLLESYGNVWIYAAGAAPYDPYGPSAMIYNNAIEKALEGCKTKLAAPGN